MSHPVTTKLVLLDDFQCLGGDCPANCCNEPWDIEIGPNVLAKWQTLPDDARKQRLFENIKTGEILGRSTVILKKAASGRCPHFRDDGLCDIHATLGEDYLGLDCRTYPRALWRNGLRTMMTATLSCPEIARRVVAHPGHRSLFRSEEDRTRTLIGGDSTIPLLEAWVDRVLTIHNVPLNVRLYYLAKTLDDLSAQAVGGEIESTILAALPKKAKDDLYAINLAVKKGQLSPAPVMTGAFWRFVYRAGAQVYDKLPVADPKVRALQTMMQDTSDKTADRHSAEIVAILQDLRADVRPRLQGMADGFERYLAVLFAYNGFPGRPIAGNFIATFTRPLVAFAATQLLLILENSDNSTAITENTVASAIYRMERVISHNPGIFTTLERNPRLLHIGGYATTLLDLF